MKFRTEIEPLKALPITADARVLLVGSCFADNIGARLAEDGFEVCHNPLGPLFNPLSVASAVERGISGHPYSASDFLFHDGTWHAMDWAARYNSPDVESLVAAVNRDFSVLSDATRRADVIFVTFGTSYVYRMLHNGVVAGNCHKLPSGMFARERISIEDIVARWRPLCRRLAELEKRVVFTVSPVRHLSDGLHGNNLSKAVLQLAVEALGGEYFPAYEIVCDDLRDYRFYASDLKHPSSQAIEYIYEKFADAYFSSDTKEIAKRRHAEWLRAAHIPGNNTL